MAERTRRAVRLFDCAWCGRLKPSAEMRNVGSSRGPCPSTCRLCRDAHPGERWCDFHHEPHPVAAFNAYPGGRAGYYNTCISACSYLASVRRDHLPITCPTCRIERQSWFFRGGGNKTISCRECEAAHPDQKWCPGCEVWLPLAEFTRSGKEMRSYARRCRPCRAAHTHGVTVAEILTKQGSTRRECAACGGSEVLMVDHDHNCCDGEVGCPRCVRGYLCRSCNRAEGFLRTPERALALARYMAKHQRILT